MHSSSLSISIVCDLTYELYVKKYALGKLVMESYYDEWKIRWLCMQWEIQVYMQCHGVSPEGVHPLCENLAVI